eukprot:UN3486
MRKEVVFVNSWKPWGEGPGWRRWRHLEFRRFSAQLQPLFPGSGHDSFVKGDGFDAPYMIYETDIRLLIPCILQAKALELREAKVKHERQYHRRTWEGAVRAIVKRTEAPYQAIKQWMAAWCEANGQVLRALHDAIEMYGPCTYFE